MESLAVFAFTRVSFFWRGVGGRGKKLNRRFAEFGFCYKNGGRDLCNVGDWKHVLGYQRRGEELK